MTPVRRNNREERVVDGEDKNFKCSYGSILTIVFFTSNAEIIFLAKIIRFNGFLDSVEAL